MARRVKFYRDVAKSKFLAVSDCLRAAGEIVAIAQPHHVERFLRRQYGTVAWAGVVGMAVGNDGALDGSNRVDMEATRLAAQAGGSWQQEVLRTHWGNIGRLARIFTRHAQT